MNKTIFWIMIGILALGTIGTWAYSNFGLWYKLLISLAFIGLSFWAYLRLDKEKENES